MQKEVLVSVKGLFFVGDTNEDPDKVEVITPGEYFLKNGKHYVIFEDVQEDFAESTRNVVKISAQQVSIKRRGIVNSDMVFEQGKLMPTHYTTPLGSLEIGIRADEIKVTEEEDRITVLIRYDLEVNYEHLNNCNVTICVMSRDSGELNL